MSRYRPPKVLHLGRGPPAMLFVMGGWTSKDRTDSVVTLPLPDGSWKTMGALPAPRAFSGATVFGTGIYLVGGESDDSSAVNTAYVYQASTDSWYSAPSLTTARRSPGVAELAHRVYAVGGWNGARIGSNTFNSAEALDPRDGVWRSIAPMTTRRRELGVAKLEGCLYAVGGYDGQTSLNSTERYDPRADKWEIVEAMAEQRSSLGVGVVGDTLYAVGGEDGTGSWLSSVEKYRAASGWETAPPMAAPRNDAAVAEYGGLLYAVAGINQGVRFLSTIAFDPETGAWSELPPLPSGCECAAAVVLS